MLRTGSVLPFGVQKRSPTMTAPDTCYDLNHDEVSHNQFDDEVIVIHLASGAYHSLRGSAAAIWARLAEGPATAAMLASLFADAGREGQAEISQFLDRLQEQRLVEPCEQPPASNPDGRAGIVFAPTELNTYHNLEGLLLADPIHDVEEEAVWPVLPDAPSNAA
jgi:PqqD family protein of HPr-rel-A system